MKKAICAFLALFMLASFAGCKIESPAEVGVGKDEPIVSTTDADIVDEAEEEEPVEDAPAVEFSAGEIDGRVYTNDFANISFVAPANWTYITEDEIDVIADAALEIVTDGSVDAEAIQTVHGMMVRCSDIKSNVQVTFEKQKLSESTYMRLIQMQLPLMYEQMNAVCEVGEITSIDICDEEYSYCEFGVELNGINLKQAYACRKIDDYFVNIIFTASTDAVLEQQKSCFGADPIAENEYIEELAEYDTGAGMILSLPAGMQELEVEGMTKTYLSNGFLVTVLKETFNELSAVGLSNIDLEKYASLTQLAYGIELPYTADVNGNLCTGYTSEVEGDDFYYYSTLREGSDCFWVVTFACPDSDKGLYEDKFTEYNNSIVVD